MFYQWSFSQPLYLNGNVKLAKQAWRISLRREQDFKKAVVFQTLGVYLGLSSCRLTEGGRVGSRLSDKDNSSPCWSIIN